MRQVLARVSIKRQYSLVFTGGLINPLKKNRRKISLTEKLQPGSNATKECVDVESHHLSEDFGVFGPGEGSVGDPAWHQPLVRVGSRPLHLSHHRLFLLLLRGKNMNA